MFWYPHIKDGDAVLDIGCNDGTLLNSYRKKGIYKISRVFTANVIVQQALDILGACLFGLGA